MTSPQNPLLTDPLLKPFLSPTFSPSTYLNTTLPPLLPPSSLNPSTSKSSSTSTSTTTPAQPLSTLSSTTTTLLSTLDLQTQTLLSALQSQTDDLLRLAPRLGYEVELLRSDVVSLGSKLNGELEVCVKELQPREVAEGEGGEEAKVLEKLRMLARVRARLEDVVRIFGHAMDWTLEGPGDPDDSDHTATAAGAENLALPTTDPLPRTPSPIRALRRVKKSSASHPVEEVLYHLSTGDLDGARRKVAELRELCALFEGTVEGPARNAVVEALEGKIAEEEARREGERRKEGGGGEVVEVDKEREREKEAGSAQGDERVEGTGWAGGREGYYGLINQLSRMRGNMT
ncbi:hypothetical protein L873DRAFT_1754602 [Choiromyces venosus 120613-1]|uniref:Uncharacterized protein n=1 Tax=Choiromyces venosus 120613-1 TaxID=1336337 RepID=A0A3N4IYK0_9PEZI|nr:hypothetical protein L873DRAFT_1754602 [Choiromyces venosus 120613-1]